MIRGFDLPDLGEGLEEATVIEWFVGPGDPVALNQVICRVETSKAEVEIPSPFAGVVVERHGDPGETLPVGSRLVAIETDGPENAPAPGGEPEGRTPVLVGYGAEPGSDRSRRRASAGVAATTSPRKPLAKPPVRKLARSLGVDLAQLSPGSGDGGIVTRADVLAGAGALEKSAPTLPVPAGTAASTVALSPVKARMAQRMALSRAQVPDATCTVQVDCSRLLALRDRLNGAEARSGVEPVVTPFALICRFVVGALVSNPLLNSTFLDDGPAVRLHDTVHLGVATATERGLLVPVVRDAQRLSTQELATQLARLVSDARANRLSPSLLHGSTFTVSNFGALGLDEGVPVINYPETAILGVGAVRPRAIVVEGTVVPRETSTFTCAFDHRVCDGAEAAAFLVRVRALVEDPELLLLSA